jgi:ferredoxin
VKITILPGCIACGVCESLCPNVFTVLESCEADNAQVFGQEDLCRDAAKACPVSVISLRE